MKVLMIDNYDSFTFNLVQYLGQCGADVHTFRNDQITIEEIKSFAPGRIVISPGPGHPGKNPACLGVGIDVLQQLSPDIPTLGVCLGCQGIGSLFGATVTQAQRLMHGKTSTVRHENVSVFAGLDNPIQVARYHSLALEPKTITGDLEITACSDDGEVMGVRHKRYPIHGVQFHPESVLTPDGMQMMKNFLNLDQGGA
jgi:anthranilate synthase/aminodeoxychorismate synthase-like glutamine amidotransferase